MRFDVDREIAQHRARRDQQAVQSASSTMFDLAVERRLLAALLCDNAIDIAPVELMRCGSCGQPEPMPAYPRTSALHLVDNLEVDDFFDPRHRRALQALRNLQHRDDPDGIGLPLSFPSGDIPWQIALEIENSDEARGSHVRQSVNLVFLVDLVLAESTATVEWIRYAQARLRDLAQIRRLA